jgi:nodulation protein E
MATSDDRATVITGMGAVSAYGIGAAPLWEALRAGRSSIAPLRHPRAAELRVEVAAQVPADFNPGAHIAERTLTMLDRSAQFALVAAAEAIAQSGLDFTLGDLSQRTGVILGTGIGGETTHDEQSHRIYGEGATRVHPLTIVRLMPNAAASQISIAHGLRGPAFVVASACASSNHALAQAAQLIRSGLADVVVTGGTEACLTYGALRAWEAMRVLSDDTCRPFSANRRGLVLAEGAAVFVLESRAHARARGARILGRLAGIGMSSDAGDIVAPDVVGASAAMTQALRDAELSPKDVDYINAHGTGTVANDLAETRAIRRSFGAHADGLAVSSTKSMHGHALGAAGALELVAVLGALADGVLPPTLNLDVPDPECDLDYVANAPRQRAIRVALSNSFAFGGLNAVLALTRD